MGRIRTIKPEFTQDEELSSLPAETHLFAAGLLCLSDDDGYFNANHGLVKAAIFPLREGSVSAHDMLTQLAKIGFIRLGTAADGKHYGQVVKFTEHQRVNRPTPSKIKGLEIEWGDSVSPHGVLSESSLPERKGKERNGTDNLSEPNDCSEDIALKEVWDYFVETLKKNPKLYQFTAVRKNKGFARLRECCALASEPKLENAINLMKVCVDRFSQDAFHNGDNKHGRKYLDWELLFRSHEKLEYWLDDHNFSNGGNQGRGYKANGCASLDAGVSR